MSALGFVGFVVMLVGVFASISSAREGRAKELVYVSIFVVGVLMFVADCLVKT